MPVPVAHVLSALLRARGIHGDVTEYVAATLTQRPGEGKLAYIRLPRTNPICMAIVTAVRSRRDWYDLAQRVRGRS